jgi:hypothetical protein
MKSVKNTLSVQVLKKSQLEDFDLALTAVVLAAGRVIGTREAKSVAIVLF